MGWCELAYETGGQQEGLSKEDSGRALLARRGRSLPVNDGGAEGWRVSFLDTLEKRIVEALDSKKWVLKAPGGEPISPDRITSRSPGILGFRSSFEFAAGCIVLTDGTRVPRVRLVRAEPVAPATTPQAVATAPAPDVTAQAAAPQEYRTATDSMIHQKLMSAFEAACAKGDPISARTAAKIVRPQLNADGRDASLRKIETLGLRQQYAGLRRPSGRTRSKRRHRAS
jgi:hypothetical protein